VSEKDPLYRAVGTRLRELRKARGVSTQALAERLGMDVANLRRIEAGSQNLTLAMMRRIASKLGATVEVSFPMSADGVPGPTPIKPPRRRVTRSR
jgi:transcriptional regulator with XRE-family HTH domain